MDWTKLKDGTLKSIDDGQFNALFVGEGKQIPRFWMSGDGHGNPPFEWMNGKSSPLLKQHFVDRMAAGKLCAHVEVYADAVTVNSVPQQFKALYESGNVFGWELEIYKSLEPVMRTCIDVAGRVDQLDSETLKLTAMSIESKIGVVERLLTDFGSPKCMAGQQAEAAKFHAAIIKGTASLDEYSMFLIGYQKAAMVMRTANEVHKKVAENIGAKVKLNPDCTHVIACGDAHLIDNPLYKFIKLPAEASGVWDKAH